MLVLDVVDRAAIAVELRRPVHAPGNRAGGHFIDLDEPDKRRAGMLAMLEDCYQQLRDAKGQGLRYAERTIFLDQPTGSEPGAEAATLICDAP